MILPFAIDLTGKTAVVTGGSGVLCSEMCRALAACGAKVAVLGRREETTAKVAGEIREAGGEAMGVAADVLDKEALLAAKERINAAYGPVDILINGAGGNNPAGNTDKEYYFDGDLDAEGLQSFFTLPGEGVNNVLKLNFLGAFLPTQVFARDMMGRKGCTVVNVSSMSAFTPLTKVMAYSAAKAALSNFTEWLAVHFAKAGLRVNAIAPGFFVTEQNRDLLKNADGSYTPRSEKIVAGTPMGRFGEPGELIGTLLWLVDERASGFVTGVVVPVDGGFAAYSGV